MKLLNVAFATLTMALWGLVFWMILMELTA